MKTVKRKLICGAAILLFILSFGYFIVLALQGLAGSLCACCAPLRDLFDADVFQEIRHYLWRWYSDEGDILIVGGLSVCLSVLILLSYLEDDIFLPETVVETAITPLVLILAYGIVWISCFAWPMHWAFYELLICIVVLAVLIAYTVLFFKAIRREFRRTDS